MTYRNPALERAILDTLARHYPQSVDAVFLAEHQMPDFQAYMGTIAYLHDLGLIKGEWPGPSSRDRGIPARKVGLTRKGRDFLESDGGLGAALDVVTVKLHEDSIKALIQSRIEAASLPPEHKRRFVAQLQALPGESARHLVLKLVDAGLENWHKALPLLKSILG